MEAMAGSQLRVLGDPTPENTGPTATELTFPNSEKLNFISKTQNRPPKNA